ncbi:MAG: imidazole glycerol phosphate synthase subunit HisH [Longimicrobiales bacterium]|nr:imidazole glycerol phosphate synthase subunit HisH [Longimicrobiales bacterium]
MTKALKTALFDYGAGNLHSLGKALEKGGAEVWITRDWDEALSSEVLVLPGVGSFGAAVRALDDRGDAVREALENGLPCLGICLGMQLFFEESEEGEGRGIGLIPGRVRKMEARRVPQMGWNDVETRVGGKEDPLFDDVDGLVAYYANSFVCEPESDDVVTARSEYDGREFVAGVRSGSTWGVQFHPEKSSTKGLRIIHNFLRLARDARS